MNLPAILRRRTREVDPEIARQVLEVLRSHGPTAAALSEKDYDAIVERRAITDDLTALEAENARRISELEAAEREALAAFKVAQAAFDSASLAWSGAQAATRNQASAYKFRTMALHHRLRSGADERLEELRVHLLDLRDELRRQPILVDEGAFVGGLSMGARMSRRQKFHSNLPAIHARLSAIVIAADEIDRAELEPDQDAAVARIGAMIAALPSSDTMTTTIHDVTVDGSRW